MIRIALVQKRVIDDEIGVLVDYFARKRLSEPFCRADAPTAVARARRPLQN